MQTRELRRADELRRRLALDVASGRKEREAAIDELAERYVPPGLRRTALRSIKGR